MNDATELGAIAIAILLIQNLTDYTEFEIGEIGTGIDFWLGKKLPEQTIEDPFSQRNARLEVSGIFEETSANTLIKRVKIKIKQIEKSRHTNLQGIVIVTSFKALKSKYLST